jgi:hypothetical protein
MRQNNAVRRDLFVAEQAGRDRVELRARRMLRRMAPIAVDDMPLKSA